jgi:hypothetical protein
MAHVFVRNIAGYSDYLAKKGKLKIEPEKITLEEQIKILRMRNVPEDEINNLIQLTQSKIIQIIDKRIEETIKIAPNNPLDILFGQIWGILNMKVNEGEKYNKITFCIKEYLEIIIESLKKEVE